MTDKFYTGIGSRKTPKNTLDHMSFIALFLDKRNYTLRSGGAIGADKAFEGGSSCKNIYTTKDVPDWAMKMVQRYIPKDLKVPFEKFAPHTKLLLARNMMQVLGYEGNIKSDFVVYWAPICNINSVEIGGTGYAVRCAIDHRIPTYNLNKSNELKEFAFFLRTL